MDAVDTLRDKKARGLTDELTQAVFNDIHEWAEIATREFSGTQCNFVSELEDGQVTLGQQV